jgi:magnesium-transporting ATPase (P-type)
VAFIFQAIAPGNKVRAGSEFGFSLEAALLTILTSLKIELAAPFQYFGRVPLLLIAFIGIIVFGWMGMAKAIRDDKTLISFRYPLLYIVIMYLLNSALNVPYIYAVDFMGVDNSTTGPMAVEHLFFILTWTSAILYLEGWLIKKYASKRSFFMDENKYRRYILLPALILCLLFTFFYKGNLKDSFAYQAYVYVKSGAAAEYKWRIAEYMEILLEDSVEEAYLKPINDRQGPLLHWTITEDETNYVNWTYKEFYRKKKVVMRDE